VLTTVFRGVNTVGRALSILGFITIVPDYRNFPQGSNEEMMDDVEAAVRWCVDNIYKYYGDVGAISLAGQSAGAQICLSLLVREFRLELLTAAAYVRNQRRLRATAIAELTANHYPEARAESADEQRDQPPKSEAQAQAQAQPHTDARPQAHAHAHAHTDDGTAASAQLDTVWRDIYSPAPKVSYRPSVSIAASSQEEDAGEDEASKVDLPPLYIPPPNMKLPSPSPSSPFPQLTSARRPHRSILSHIRLYMGISGPYNLPYLAAHMHRRGLDVTILHKIFHSDLEKYSPTFMLRDLIEEFQVGRERQGEYSRHHNNSSESGSPCKSPTISDYFEEPLEEDELADIIRRVLYLRQRHVELGTPDDDDDDDDLEARSPNDSVSDVDETTSSRANSDCGPGSVEREPDGLAPVANVLPLLTYFPPVFLFHGNEDHSSPAEVRTLNIFM
jgi:acetyl esterase/lipase